jgi:alpha-L-fucosidase
LIGDWDQTSDYWKSRQFFAWLFNDSPVRETVVVNDRWGKDTEGKHGSYFTGGDRYDPSHLVKRKWENCYTIDKDSWGFARNHNLDKYFSSKDLIYTLIRNVAFGGNLLLNIGPALDGTIPIIFQDRLRDIGTWLSVNGEAIYETQPWRVQNQTQPDGFMGYFTESSAGDAIYYIIQGWPLNSIITLTQPVAGTAAQVQLLGFNTNLQFKYNPGKLEIALPPINYVNSRDAYTIKLVHFK